MTPRINPENFESQLDSCQIRNGDCDRRLSFQSRRLDKTARCRGRRDVRGEVDRYQDCVVMDSCVQTRDDAVLSVCVWAIDVIEMKSTGQGRGSRRWLLCRGRGESGRYCPRCGCVPEYRVALRKLVAEEWERGSCLRIF